MVLRQAQVLKNQWCPVLFFAKKAPDTTDFSKPELASTPLGLMHECFHRHPGPRAHAE
jgi:hypothetical protein